MLVAEGVSNGPSDEAADAALRAAERAARAPRGALGASQPALGASQPALGASQPEVSAPDDPHRAVSAPDDPDRAVSAPDDPDRAISALEHPHLAVSALDHPHLAAWRAAFRAFGAKRHLCSAEALIQRAVSGDGLPRISALVDRYNAVSVLHAIPVGGEDLDRVVPPVRLSFASGDERFDDGGVRAGEVVWADAAGVTCRRWNWRQGVRTRLTSSTTRAYFLFDALPPLTDAELDAAMGDLAASLRTAWPSADLVARVLDQRTAAG